MPYDLRAAVEEKGCPMSHVDIGHPGLPRSWDPPR